MATALVVFACSKKEEDAPVEDNVVPVEVEETGRIVTLTASVDEPDTKVAIVDHKYNWQAGDVIGVFQSNGSEDPIEFSTTESGASASFTASTSATLGNYAVYPYASSQASDYELIEDSGDYLMTMILPGSYDYQENALNIPMLGVVSGSDVSFMAIGGVIRFTVTNIPATAAIFSFQATNKQIAGEFDILATASTPQLNLVDGSTGKVVSIDFTPNTGSTHTFSIPVPVGTIDGFTLAVFDSSYEELYSVTSSANITVSRNDIITAPTLQLPDEEEVINTTHYEKVNTAPLENGDYLLVYEEGTDAYVFNGEDAVNGYVSGTISEGIIASTPTIDAVALTIESMTGGYSLLVNSGTHNGSYLLGTDANGLAFSDVPSAHSVSYSEGELTLQDVNHTATTMKFNSASNQRRFRYYKSGQQEVALYKKVSISGSKLNAPAGLKVASATKTVSWKPVYHATSYDVTVNGSTNNVTSTSYVFTGEDGYYDVSVVAKSTDPTKFDSDAAELSNQKFGNPALAAPTSFVTGTVTDNSIQVSWTGDAHATKYHCTISPADADAQDVTTNSVTFSGLTENESYTISVYAIDETGRYSNSLTGSSSSIKAVSLGDSYSYTFTTNPFGEYDGRDSNTETTKSAKLGSYTWDLTATYIKVNTSPYLQLTTGSRTDNATFSNTDYNKYITKIILVVKTNSSKSVTVNASVDGTDFTCDKSTTVSSTSDVKLTFTSVTAKKGEIKFEFTGATGGYYIKSFSINPD